MGGSYIMGYVTRTIRLADLKRGLGEFQTLCDLDHTNMDGTGAEFNVFKKTVDLTDWDYLICTAIHNSEGDVSTIKLYGDAATLGTAAAVGDGDAFYFKVDVSALGITVLRVTINCDSAEDCLLEELVIYEMEA